MDIFLLWALLLTGISLLICSLRKTPITQWLLIFFMTAYLSTFIGVFVVENKMLEYPVSFLSNYFDSSLLFEYLLFPVVSIYFYQTTYHSKTLGIIFQSLIYSGVLTIVEALFERYTNLVEYLSWIWVYSFGAIFLFLLFVRGIMALIYKKGV